MRIDKKLNLIVPIETAAGTTYIHSTPIGREAFDKYFLVISKTFAAIYSEGLSVIAGPRVAAMMLKKISEIAGVWDGPEGVELGLMAEIRRMSNVVRLTENGWQPIPLQMALDKGLLDSEDIEEAEGAIVFFTLASLMHRRNEIPEVLGGLCRLWGTQTSFLSVMEYQKSLPTSTPDANTGETATVSSIPV